MFLLSSANEAILDLLEGHIPELIPLDRFEDCDDTRQLIETLNELI